MAIVYTCFGAEAYRLQTLYSVYTLRMQQYSGAVQVHTDAPEWFDRHMDLIPGPAPAVRNLDMQALTRACANGYLYKAKLVILDQVLREGLPWALFVDCDTVIEASLHRLILQLADDAAVLLHESEGRLDEGMPTLRALLSDSRTQHWVRPEDRIYNTGVVGLSASRRELLCRAMRLCDELVSSGAEIHTFEQLAVSIALREREDAVECCWPQVNHYWHAKKKFTRRIAAMVEAGHLKWIAPPLKLDYLTLRDVAAYIRRHPRPVRELIRLALRLGWVDKPGLARRERQRLQREAPLRRER